MIIPKRRDAASRWPPKIRTVSSTLPNWSDSSELLAGCEPARYTGNISAVIRLWLSTGRVISLSRKYLRVMGLWDHCKIWWMHNKLYKIFIFLVFIFIPYLSSRPLDMTDFYFSHNWMVQSPITNPFCVTPFVDLYHALRRPVFNNLEWPW